MLYYSDGIGIYEGEFKNDYFEGFGIMCYFRLKYIKYKGQWKEGFPNGYGFSKFYNFKYEG